MDTLIKPVVFYREIVNGHTDKKVVPALPECPLSEVHRVRVYLPNRLNVLTVAMKFSSISLFVVK